MKWFRFNKRKHSPTKINVSKSDRSSHKSSGSRSGRGDGSSGHSSSRRRRRHSHSTSLPRDIYTRSYYAPPQRNFYPPNVVRPPHIQQKVLAPLGYFQNQPPPHMDYEDNLVDERVYAQQLYRNQFLFFRPKKTVKPNNAPFSVEPSDGIGNRQYAIDTVNAWETANRHSAPVFSSPAGQIQIPNWNWTLQQRSFDHKPNVITTIRRVSG